MSARREANEQRPVLPVCILTTARVEAGARPDVLCMRMSCPGAIERAFTIEGGVGAAVCHAVDRIESLGNLPVDPETVAAMIDGAAQDALLVVWDLDTTLVDLAAFHPAPQQLVARGAFALDLAAVGLLVGAIHGGGAPTLGGLAAALALTPPGEGVRERGWFLARAVRRLSASSAWLARVLALGFNERAILETCVERLGTGARTYGPWQLEDGRDYAREAYEEVIDGLHYAAAGLLRLRETNTVKEVG